ncbi:unnamed protein product [Brachionus calyciflorus]|uniref:Uncharacterized protein n=1 Tax=Brachionus calyciflorus TaxID=104777 RepID=A0A813XTR5_9BILA|nr:unnamed protein product [Brachionus calyciflorus]
MVSILTKLKEKIAKARKKQFKRKKGISFFKLLSFSDWIDKFLMIIGILASLGASAIFPLMYVFYGQVANLFINYGNQTNNTNSNLTEFSSSTTPFALFNLTTTLAQNVSNDKCLTKKSTDSDSEINDIVKYYVIFGFACLVFEYILYAAWNTAGERQVNKMRNKLYETIIRQDMAFFDKSTSNDLISILDGFDTIKETINYEFADSLCYFAKGTASLILAMIKAWKFTIVFLPFVPIMIFSKSIVTIFVKKYTKKELEAYGNASSVSQEALSSVRTVQALGLVNYSIQNYSTCLEKSEKMAQKKGIVSGSFSGFYGGLQCLFFGIAVYYGIYLTRTECENYNAENIIQAFFLLISCINSTGLAFPYLKKLAEAKGAAKKIFEILETKSKIDVFASNDKKLNEVKGEIEFKDIHFSYPSREEIKILNGLNLKFPAGKTIALVGPSGCGKSTVFCLLQKLYLPQSGQIKLDGRNIDDLDLRWLREQIAIVSQDPVLFSISIKDNIKLGRLDATDAEIEQAAKIANAHEFIMKCPDKYNSLVGEQGSQLSGGQKQRIAIARAIVRNPKILLLDEATSALDYTNERKIQDAIDKAKIGRTTIIIAHRLNTIKNADIIAFISNGQLKEIGSHDELMDLKGLYFDLYQNNVDSKVEENDDSDEISPIETKSDSLSSSSDDDDDDDDVKKGQDAEKLDKKKRKKLKLNRKKIFSYEKKVLKMQKPEIIYIILEFCTAMFLGCYNSLINYVFSEIFIMFKFDSEKQKTESLKYMGILFGIGFVNLISNVTYEYSVSVNGSRLTKRFREFMFKSLMRQEIGFHDLDENRSSILVTKLSKTAPHCKGLTTDKLGLLVQAISAYVFSISFGLVLSWKLTLVMFSFVPFITFFSQMVRVLNVNNKVKDKSETQETNRILIETLQNIKTIIHLGREKYFIEEFNRVCKRKMKKTLLIHQLAGLFFGLLRGCLFFIQAASFSFGFYLISRNELSIGNFFKVFQLIRVTTLIMGFLLIKLPDRKKSKSAAKQAFKIIERKSQIDPLDETGQKPNTFIGNIRFENVQFHYPNSKNAKVLDGFNLTIRDGETNALVGPPGSGKSTIVSLLLRFYDINNGAIYLDDLDIRKLNINWLRSKIGYISQEPVLFQGSILKNISLGDITRDNISINEIIKVANDANIHNKIESFPEKYDTLVGSKGSQISCGEKQRIVIARALIRNPKILLLDEATSALDNESQQIVQKAFDKAKVGRTCVVIAHRLDTIENANKISVIKDGVLIEEGTHVELIEKKGFFYNLKNQQKN